MFTIELMKILILHDFISVRGGAERLILTLLDGLKQSFDVTLVSGYINYDLFPELKNRKDIISLCQQTNIKGWESLKMMWCFKRHNHLTTHYDVCIFSGIYSLAARKDILGQTHINYCHTPPRFVYDLKRYYRNLAKPWQVPFLFLLRKIVNIQYERSIRKMDTILTNSLNTKKRLNDFLQVEASVLYPPVNVKRFTWQAPSNYYLSTARLESYKRVELIVEAFKRTPSKKLVLASSGHLLPKLLNATKDYSNIVVTGWLSEEKLKELLEQCIATIYIPINEDFGISPVESMAAGKPVIGVKEGGLKETVLDNKTGLLLTSPPTIDELIKAILSLSRSKSTTMRSECEKRASLFNEENFLERMHYIIKSR